jgi:hypothetical protein
VLGELGDPQLHPGLGREPAAPVGVRVGIEMHPTPAPARGRRPEPDPDGPRRIGAGHSITPLPGTVAGSADRTRSSLTETDLRAGARKGHRVFGKKKSAKKTAKAASKSSKKAAAADKAAAESAAAAAEAAAARDEADRAAADASVAGAAVTKADRKAEKKSVKAEKKAAKAADKAAAAAAPKSLLDRVTDPREAKKAIAVVRIAGPVIAPFALKAATATRGWMDERRAHQLGVTALEVAAYRGPTGATEARLAGLTAALSDLKRRHGGNLQAVRFAEVADQRVADLTIAVRAAASMPSPRRRSTLQAVGRDLDRIDADLMTYLLPTPGVPGAHAKPSLTK